MLPIVNFYSSAFDNKVEQIEVENGTAIKNVKQLEKVDFQNTVIFVNGHQADETTVLKENDICTLREFPKGTGVLVGVGVTAVVWGLSELLSYEFTGKSIGQNIVEGIQDWIKSLMPEMQTQEQTEQIPSIQGGKNQSGANQPFPLIIGETYYTPLYIGTPYVTIDPSKQNNGEDEYFTALYCLGQKDIEVRDFNLGIYKIADNTENVMNGFVDTSESIYKPSEYDTKLEIRNGSEEVSLYPQKIVQESLNSLLTNVENQGALVVKPFSARYTQKVRLEVMFQALNKYSKDDGSIESTSVEIGFAYSKDAGASYSALTQDGSWGNNPNEITISFSRTVTDTDGKTYAVYKFTGAKNKQMRFCLDKTFSWLDAKYAQDNGLSVFEFAVKRFTEDSTDTSIQDKAYFTRITSWCYDYEKSTEQNRFVSQSPLDSRFMPLVTRAGFKIKSGTDIQGTLNAFNCIVKAKGRTYNKNTGWSDTLSVTNNPASMALLVMQTDYRGEKYKYKDSQLDLYSFGQLYERCASPDEKILDKNGQCEPMYTVNGVINTQKKTKDILNAILTTANSYLVLKGNKYGIFVDEPQDNPVMVLNNQNVLEASNSKAFDEPIHEYKIRFVNKENYYKADTMPCVPNKYKNISEQEKNIVETELLFYTDPKRVYRKAMRMIAEKELRPEVWTRKVSIEGNLIEIGNLVELQDDTISVGIGNGAEITEVIYDDNQNITGIKTDGEFEVTMQDNHGVKITQADGIHQPVVRKYQVKESAKGTYTDFTFENSISADETVKPCVGDIVTFGVYNKETVRALCFGKKDNGDGTFTLTFVPYDSGVYTSETGDIPEFTSNVTPPIQNGVLTETTEKQLTVQDVINLKIDGKDGYSLYIENNTYVINADYTGNIAEELEVRSLVHFMHGTDEEYFDFEEIIAPNGMSIHTDDKEVVFRFLKGTNLPMNGTVEIPIRVAGNVEDVRFVITNDTYLGIGTDYLGYYIQHDFKVYSLYFSYAKSVKGKDGEDGTGLATVIEYYLTSNEKTGITKATAGWTTSVQYVSPDKLYLWNYEKVIYTDGITTETEPQMLGSFGNGIKSITEYYAISSSNTTAPSKPYTTGVKTPTDASPYLWNYEVITYLDGTTTETSPAWINGPRGLKGDKGDKGDKGVRGGRYLGTYTSDSSVSAPVKDDFYLNTSTGYVRYYDGSKFNNVDSTTDSRYQQAIGDITNIMKSLPTTAPAKTAGTAFIDHLFANEITINTNGVIKSLTYDNNTGFKINADGSATFKNGKIGVFNINTELISTIDEDNNMKIFKSGLVSINDLVVKKLRGDLLSEIIPFSMINNYINLTKSIQTFYNGLCSRIFKKNITEQVYFHVYGTIKAQYSKFTTTYNLNSEILICYTNALDYTTICLELKNNTIIILYGTKNEYDEYIYTKGEVLFYSNLLNGIPQYDTYSLLSTNFMAKCFL